MRQFKEKLSNNNNIFLTGSSLKKKLKSFVLIFVFKHYNKQTCNQMTKLCIFLLQLILC